LIAFIVFGSIAGVILAQWTTTGATAVAPWWPIAAPIAAAVAAGFAETVPLKLNDNITVPAIAVLVLAPLAGVEHAQLVAWSPIIVNRLPLAIGVNAVFALLGWLAGTVTIGWRGRRLRHRRRRVRGDGLVRLDHAVRDVSGRGDHDAESAIARKRRLASRKAAAAGAVPATRSPTLDSPAFAALISVGAFRADLARLAMVAALVTAASDTVASEIGKAFGRTTWLVTTLRRVRPGTSGAVSLEGTAAGIVSAAALASAAAWLGLMPSPSIALVVVAATIAALVEGALGATLEDRGLLNNDALNFVNALMGAGLAWRCASMLA
jgi:uncharacterized protein (TIGR00297 family)